MLFTSLSALLLFFLYAGIGLLFDSRKEVDLQRLARDFWLGWAIALGFLQLWHFFWPVNSLSGIILAAVGAVGWVRRRGAVAASLKAAALRRKILGTGGLLAGAVFMANQVLTGELHIDHGLYHLQTVKWLQSFALVPGLGNLHHRLAFNNASLLFAAQLNAGFLDGYAFSLVNTVLGLAVAAGCIGSLHKLFTLGKKLQYADVFSILLLPLLVFHTRLVAFAGYSPDVAVFALQCALALELLCLIDSDGKDQNALNRLLLLGAVSVCVKLSAVVFAGSVMLAGMGIFLRAAKIPFSVLFKRHLPRCVGLVAILILPWLVRGALLSGYLLYPLSLFPLPLVWRMPDSMVDPVARIISLWARFGGVEVLEQGLPNLMRLWVERNPQIYTRVVLYAAALLLGSSFILLLKKKLKESGGWGWLLLVALLGLVYWFASAPDPRFAGAAFWLLLSAALMAALQAVTSLFPRLPRKALVAIAMLGLFVWLRPPLIRLVDAVRLGMPLNEHAFAAVQVRQENTPYLRTASGLKVYIANDYTRGACWDAPLPCTSLNDFVPDLQLIEADRLQSGFYYDYPQ